MFVLYLMVFGDVNNDKDMLEFVEYSYVMVNSEDKLLFNIVCYVVFFNDE